PQKERVFFRAVPAGRRRHGSQARRNGPRPRDQPRARSAARRRDPPPEHPGAGQHIHALPAAHVRGRGRGTHSTLSLPLTYAGAAVLPEIEPRDPTRPLKLAAAAASMPRPQTIADDRAARVASDRVMLLAEDDPEFAQIWLGVVRARGFKGIVATRGADALMLARKHRPHAVCLDIGFPPTLGWSGVGPLKQEPPTP